jgi:hypothetical protein
LSAQTVNIHELIAWGLDDYPYRDSTLGSRPEELAKQVEEARRQMPDRRSYVSCPAFLAQETESLKHLLAASAQRADLQEEHQGLDWGLGVVDLRCLLAFQRRLVFNPAVKHPPLPAQDDWAALISLAIGAPRGTKHCLVRHENNDGITDISLHSSNPDLQLRIHYRGGQGDASSLSLYGGSPFFEVAELRGRWFLRDGYHRAYRLLQAGVHRIPAVVIHARTMEELGATDPWFFGEEQLFSDHPPRVIDFLEERLVLRYKRLALRKVLRVRIEESLQPFDEIEAQGETT